MARLARMTAAEYPNDNYVCLDRQFYDVDLKTADGTNDILAQQLVGDKIRWSDLTSRHRVVVLAAAGVGKTAEFRAAANNQLRAGNSAFFLPIEQICQRGVVETLGLHRLRQFVRHVAGVSAFHWPSTPTVGRDSDLGPRNAACDIRMPTLYLDIPIVVPHLVDHG
jgi:hypothetical protein